MPTELVHIDQALHEMSGGLAGCHASSWSPPPELGRTEKGKELGLIYSQAGYCRVPVTQTLSTYGCLRAVYLYSFIFL